MLCPRCEENNKKVELKEYQYSNGSYVSDIIEYECPECGYETNTSELNELDYDLLCKETD